MDVHIVQGSSGSGHTQKNIQKLEVKGKDNKKSTVQIRYGLDHHWHTILRKPQNLAFQVLVYNPSPILLAMGSLLLNDFPSEFTVTMSKSSICNVPLKGL